METPWYRDGLGPLGPASASLRHEFSKQPKGRWGYSKRIGRGTPSEKNSSSSASAVACRPSTCPHQKSMGVPHNMIKP